MSITFQQDETIYSGKWLELKFRHFTTPDGAPKTWEYCSRKNAPDSQSIGVIPIVQRGDKQFVILVAVQRHPAERRVIEYPGGLIEHNEDIRAAGLRELREETGYMADESDIVHCSPVMFNDPWKSDETSHFIIVKIDGNREENINPQQNLQGEEDILVFEVEKDRMLEEIQRIASENNWGLLTGVYNFALGMHISTQNPNLLN